MVNVSNVEIPYDKLLARLGYSHNKTRLDIKIISSIIENLSLAQKLIKPKSVIAVENITLHKDLVSFENGYKIKSNNIATLLKNCFKAYGIVVTIGDALEKKRDDCLKKRGIFDALILDAAGSVAAEETITLANAQIRAYEEKNDNIVMRRYSPGYGDWPLEANKQFLNWIGTTRVGITLNKFCHMKPEKSVSALIGIKKLT
ncbi:MAG: vitamin B12 dependent-methionine synthase activation domain-containing protein [Endomicrobiia bacterium]|nr:MAG: vitamin B12 dependent-methionine synthase activation domain-containing protein [Endomicrobiia bacterium]